jgi:hypothetical protein
MYIAPVGSDESLITYNADANALLTCPMIQAVIMSGASLRGNTHRGTQYSVMCDRLKHYRQARVAAQVSKWVITA